MFYILMSQITRMIGKLANIQSRYTTPFLFCEPESWISLKLFNCNWTNILTTTKIISIGNWFTCIHPCKCWMVRKMSIGHILQYSCNVRILDHINSTRNVLIPCYWKDPLCAMDACCKMIHSTGVDVYLFHLGICVLWVLGSAMVCFFDHNPYQWRSLCCCWCKYQLIADWRLISWPSILVYTPYVLIPTIVFFHYQ